MWESRREVYSQEDLDLFFQILHRMYLKIPLSGTRLTAFSEIPNGTHPIVKAVDNITVSVPADKVTRSGGEVATDIEVSYPIIWPQNSVLYGMEPEGPSADGTNLILGFLSAIDGSYCTSSSSTFSPVSPNWAPGNNSGVHKCGGFKPPNGISISYCDMENIFAQNYIQRQCFEFLKLGLQGVSVVVASGDVGVGGNHCKTKGDCCLGDNYPASCPYVTSVGGTQMNDSQSYGEIAVTEDISSSGGFSNVFPCPDYQRGAVEKYFNVSKPPYPYYSQPKNGSNIGTNGGICNRAGRAFPDVSAQSAKFAAYLGGELLHNGGGTSASAPIIAAILTRINAERLSHNKSTVGFVNPTLYAHPEALNDITVGNNSGCGTGGFKAAAGWDPVTKLGTPNYKKMLDLFMRMN